MHKKLLTAVALCAALSGWLFSPMAALAHSRLLNSSPVAGTVLDTPPQQILMSFSEPIGLEFSAVNLYDRARTEVPLGTLSHSTGDGTKVAVDIPSKLGAGTYTVVWRVVSATDGHLTAGSFAFRVRGAAGGTPEPEESPVPFGETTSAPVEGSSESADPFRWLIKGIILAAAALLTGGPLFTVLIVEPTVIERGEVGAALWRVLPRRFAQIGWVAGCLLLVALLADLVAEVAAVAPTTYLGAFGRGDLALLLITSTRYGFALSFKVLAAALLLVLFAWLAARRTTAPERTGSGLWEVSIAAGSLLLLAEALSSHGAAVESDHFLGLPLPVVSDWLHLVTASAWVGGLGYFALVLFPAFRALGLTAEERRAFLAASVPRFSRLAIASVITLAATGTYNLVVQSTDLVAILRSSYGQLLVVKHVLLICLLALGAINLLRLSPRLRKQPPHNDGGDGIAPVIAPVGALRRNVRTELVLAGIVLLCAGGLTLLPPPRGAGSTYAAAPGAETPVALVPTTPAQPTAIEATTTPVTAIANTTVGGYRFVLETRPSIEGDEFTLTVTKALVAAPALTDVTKVLLKITPQDVDAGSTSYTADKLPGGDNNLGVWRVTDQILTLDGGYLVTAIVRRTASDDLKAGFRLDLSEEGLTASAAQVVEARVSTDPSPPISGTATLRIALVDGEGKPVEGATLVINPLMPSHAHKEPTGTANPVPGQPGVYTMPVHFTMGGGWLLVFNVERPGVPTIKTDASLDVIDPNATPTPAATPSP